MCFTPMAIGTGKRNLITQGHRAKQRSQSLNMTQQLLTQTVTRNLKDLTLLEKNARYMTVTQFGRLVDNLKRDGVLTSYPLIYKNVVLSDNHRVQAAIEAGIIDSPCIEVLTELTQEQQTTIVLSHNAISGQDDLSTLQELYESLGLELKAYSGLTDDSFKLEEIDIDSLSLGTPKYEELLILFLPEELTVFQEAVKKLEKSKARKAFAAHYADYADIFQAVTETKKKLDIHNTAMALRVMADLALKQLDQMAEEAENEQADKA